jgi:hypothetical protein
VIKNGLPVNRNGRLGGFLPGETTPGPPVSTAAEFGRSGGIVVEKKHGLRQGPAVAGRHQQTGIPDNLGQCAAGGADYRHAAGHGLDHRQAESLVERRRDGHGCPGILAHDFLGVDGSGE